MKSQKPLKSSLKSWIDRLLEDPCSIGDALKGSELGEFWKYRVGDWRVICQIKDKQIVITVITLGNRREVYR